MTTHRAIRLLLLSLLFAAIAADPAGPVCAGALGDEDIRTLQGRVVQVESTLPSGGEVGSAILVGSRQGYLYLLTADHVLRQGLSTAQDVRVRFHFWQEEWVSAEVLEPSDPDLDLGVLRVNLAEAPFLRRAVEILEPVAHGGEARLSRGDRLVPIGHPQGRAWYTPVDPPPVMDVVANVVRFEYDCDGGASGGAVFDERLRLRGMIQRYDGKLCLALVFPVLRQVVEDRWGIPFNLLVGPPPPGADDGRTVRVVVELEDPGRADLLSPARQALRSLVSPIKGLELMDDDAPTPDGGAASGDPVILRLRIGPVEVSRRKFQGYGIDGVADHSSLRIGVELVEEGSGRVYYSESFEGRHRQTYGDAAGAPSAPEDRGNDLLRDGLDQAREGLTGALVTLSGR